MGAMKKQIIISAVVAAVLTVVVVGMALSLLRNGPGDAGEDPAAPREDSVAQVAQRPDCPAGPVAGVDLPCLGGGTGGEFSEVAVVNLWAHWCIPCRAELPIMAQAAEAHPEWTVVGVHADKNSPAGADLLNELDSPLPSFEDTSNLFAGTLGLPRVIPITVIVQDGEMVGQYAKEFTSVEEIEAAVAESVS